MNFSYSYLHMFLHSILYFLCSFHSQKPIFSEHFPKILCAYANHFLIKLPLSIILFGLTIFFKPHLEYTRIILSSSFHSYNYCSQYIFCEQLASNLQTKTFASKIKRSDIPKEKIGKTIGTLMKYKIYLNLLLYNRDSYSYSHSDVIFLTKNFFV